MARALLETHLPDVKLAARGKVRDIYDLIDRLLFVATDRLSAFDCVLPNPIPGKGQVLTRISKFWFDRFADRIPNHVLATEIEDFPECLQPYAEQLVGRSMLVRKLEMVPVECVARGYLAGSGWKEYRSNGTVCGIRLPPGLKESAKLPEPIFTPATKAHDGHDENIPFSEVENLVGSDLACRLRDTTLEIYDRGAEYARSRGIIIADTKFEFGYQDGVLILADEVLTPDSSRFWPEDQYEEGRGQASFDKQFVRDWLERTSWNKQPPAPKLPDDIVEGLASRYREVYRILTGETL